MQIDQRAEGWSQRAGGGRPAKAGASMGHLITLPIALQIGPDCWSGLEILPMHEFHAQNL